MQYEEITTIPIPPACSSQHGMLCCPGDIAYGVGKAAAVYMTRQLAVDLAGKLVACNAVAPGKIITGHDTDVREYRFAFLRGDTTDPWFHLFTKAGPFQRGVVTLLEAIKILDLGDIL